MRRVRIEVSRLREYSGDSGFEVYGDLGSGVVDDAHPLSPRLVRLWSEAVPRRGHLLDGHLTIRHADSVRPDGHLGGSHLNDECLWPAAAVGFETPAYVFGRFLHAVKMRDGAGNTSIATETAVTVNSAPTRPENVRRSGYDSVSDRLTFGFAPARFEPIAGG